MKKMTGILAIAVLLSSQSLFAQGWGTITGRIVVDGAPPKLADLVAKNDPTAKDAGICAVNAIPDEKLIVGKKGGLANCVVFLYQRRGTPDIHPDLKKSAEATLKFDNKGCRFIPHTMIVRTDQKVNCTNSDACGHNIHTFPLRNQGLNQLVAANDQEGIDIEFAKGEPLPMQVKCDIHPWMTANWFVCEHPYAIVTDAEGRFTIKLVPEGEHKFRIWHEVPGYVKKDGDRDVEVEIKAGKVLDLGDIKISAADLEE
ncbi:MAG: hypothetical protein JKY95_10220 [Planctomycetaceae bacterium]|nr:hypothetical protein [Planctomycetaceae bacterium]